MTKLTRFLTAEEREAMNDDAISRGFYRDDRRIFTPGMGWFEPWYWDPTGKETTGRVRPGSPFLSIFYWNEWSNVRPPICIVCPNGEQWEIDRKSSNGDGWKVTGEWPLLTCSPSIVVEGYHGFLQNGVFTPDIEGRGPTGVRRPDPPPREVP